MSLIHGWRLRRPLVAFQQFRRLDADGLRQVLRSVVLAPATLRHKITNRLNGTVTDHD